MSERVGNCVFEQVRGALLHRALPIQENALGMIKIIFTILYLVNAASSNACGPVTIAIKNKAFVNTCAVDVFLSD